MNDKYSYESYIYIYSFPAQKLPFAAIQNFPKILEKIEMKPP